MTALSKSYLWQHPNWTNFRWDTSALFEIYGACRQEQGVLRAQVETLGLEDRLEAQAETLVEEAIKTSAIEGESLDPEQVRSSVARHLGLPSVGLRQADRDVDGLVEILLDATRNYAAPMTLERLQGWQAALFPTGYSGMHKIVIGDWRSDAMQVLSGPIGREIVHFEAPPPENLELEMIKLFSW